MLCPRSSLAHIGNCADQWRLTYRTCSLEKPSENDAKRVAAVQSLGPPVEPGKDRRRGSAAKSWRAGRGLMPGSTPSRQYFGLAITTRSSGEPPGIIIVGIENRSKV